MARGAVVVTGASTGIGEATAKHLRELGFDVIGGVRRREDGERLRSAGIEPLILDVTDERQVAAAHERVGEGALAGLVNNAGIGIGAPIEFVPLDELRRQLEVNVVGQVAMIQALLPALRRGRGRIVNVSSIGGRIALPMAGPYAASKHALEAVSDSLRRELRGQGIEVVLVEPGGVKTPIWAKSRERAASMRERAGPEADELYGPLMRVVESETEKIERERGLPPSAVAEVIGEALTARRPKTRYLVGRDAKMRARVAKRVPDRVMDALIARALGG